MLFDMLYNWYLPEFSKM